MPTDEMPQDDRAHPDGLTFAEVLTECTHNREFRENYNRLRPAHIGAWPIGTRSAVKEKEFARFAAFVFDVVWCRLPGVVVDDASIRWSNGPGYDNPDDS